MNDYQLVYATQPRAMPYVPSLGHGAACAVRLYIALGVASTKAPVFHAAPKLGLHNARDLRLSCSTAFASVSVLQPADSCQGTFVPERTCPATLCPVHMPLLCRDVIYTAEEYWLRYLLQDGATLTDNPW